MRTFSVLYLSFIIYLLAITMPESQRCWSCLNENVLSLIRYIRSATPARLLQCHFGNTNNSISAEAPFSSVGGIDVCRVSAFEIDSICHPLDAPIVPTPTHLLDISATRTVSAIAPSPVAYCLVPYEDMFPTQPKIKIRSRKSKESRQGGVPSDVEQNNLFALLCATISTMIVVQFLMVRKVTSDLLSP